MQMCENVKRIIRIFALILVLVITISSTGVVCNHPTDLDELTVKSFYEEEYPLDYIAIGSSAVINDLFPVTLWKECNLSGHCLGVAGADARLYKSMLREAMENNSNALIIVDMDGFTSEINGKGVIDNWLDSMKNSKNKYQSINELDYENRFEHYFPILKYHKNTTVFYSFFSQIITLYNLDNKDELNLMKGARPMYKLRVSDEVNKKMVVFSDVIEDKVAPNKNMEKIFDEFLSYCKEKNIENVLFVNFPKTYYDENTYEHNISLTKIINYYKERINDNGYRLLNYDMIIENAGLSVEDFSDNYHLFSWGAVKFSKYLGQYLRDNYTFNEHSQESVNEWNNLVEIAYKKYDL